MSTRTSRPAGRGPSRRSGQRFPVLLGCRLTARGCAEIVRWGDRWIGYGSDLDLFTSQVTTLRSHWSAAGRGEAGPRLWPMLGIVDDETLRRSLDRFLALGVDQLVLDLQAAEDNLLPILDRYATVLATT